MGVFSNDGEEDVCVWVFVILLVTLILAFICFGISGLMLVSTGYVITVFGIITVGLIAGWVSKSKMKQTTQE